MLIMMFDEDYLLDDIESIESARRYRNIIMNGNYSIKEFGSILSDYSIYYLFETMRMIVHYSGISCYEDSFKKAIMNNDVECERGKYRRRVYFSLKTSKYDDKYVEDTIEKYVDCLISFCINLNELFNFYSAYDNGKRDTDNLVLNNSYRNLIKKRTKNWLQ